MDSMPLEVCKLSRSTRSIICRETDYAIPNKGDCVSQKMHYYGYKIHGFAQGKESFKVWILVLYKCMKFIVLKM